ncbi:serine hydrolase domain-containing protein [Nocardiopsis alba]|uniref:serine hydrolase domain-containing protein n=1 Tax=Nocardiopsis alba TaxID=53437 RepID=UPI0033E8B921
MTSSDTLTAPPSPPSGSPRSRGKSPAAPGRIWLLALVVGVIAAVLAHLFAPARATPATGIEGDETLAADVERILGDRIVEVQGLSVARFDLDDPEAVEWASGGTADGSTPVGPDTPFETGSVMKVLTGMLLAEMVERGDTSPDRTLAEIFPDIDFDDPEVASITLEEMATHHSGLGAVPTGDENTVLLDSLLLIGPYESATPPVEGLVHSTAGSKEHYLYSNHAFAVLGHALAAEADSTYPELVRERILDPLGMDDTEVSAERPEGGVLPYFEPGVRVAPWTAVDYAPAGVATWSTVSDLVTLAAAVDDGTAPGASSVEVLREAVTTAGEVSEEEPAGGGDEETVMSLGMAWHHLRFPDGREVTFHNGKVYGSSTTVMFDDERAVVLMGNSYTLQETGLALGLLEGESGEPLTEPSTAVPFVLGMTVFLLVVPPVLLLALMIGRRTLITRRPLDRMRIVSLSLGNLAWMVYLQRGGVWTDLPSVAFPIAFGAVAAAITVGVWHWRRVPVEAGRFRWLHVTVFVLSTLFSLTLLGAMAYALAVAYV